MLFDPIENNTSKNVKKGILMAAVEQRPFLYVSQIKVFFCNNAH